MTEALMKTDAVAKARTSKPSAHAEPFAVAPKLAMPAFNFPSVEVPVVLRDWAEQGLEQARSNYEIVKTTAEEAALAVEDTYSAALKGAADYGLKALDVARANTNAVFDFARDLISAKSPSELIELSTGHARKQFETFSSQTRELAELAQKVATDAGAPVCNAVSKTLKKTS